MDNLTKVVERGNIVFVKGKVGDIVSVRYNQMYKNATIILGQENYTSPNHAYVNVKIINITNIGFDVIITNATSNDYSPYFNYIVLCEI